MPTLQSQVTGRRYRLLAQLARGGMGQVFVGQEVGPKALPGAGYVALKTLLPDVAADPVMLGRFLDEARLSARLEHPHIARTLDFGEAAGRPFLVFELLRGADLGDCLDAVILRRGQVPPEVACLLLAQAARGLHFAHTLEKDGRPLQVVHRDLSPGNLFLGSDGVVKVLDFGAASGRDRLTRTATGLVIGKLEYMAPEQVKGTRLDGRTDVFALGLCLFEALTLRRPYAGLDEREQIRRIFAAQLPNLEEHRPDLPAELRQLVARATAPELTGRYESAQALAEALEACAAKLTRAPAQAVLQGFYRTCFGDERTQAREARLTELRAAPEAEAPFEWAAPELLPAEPQALLPTPQLDRSERPTPHERPPQAVRDPVRDTEVDNRPVLPVLYPRTTVDPAPPAPMATAAPAPSRAPAWGYAVVAAVVLGMLGLGLALGKLLAR